MANWGIASGMGGAGGNGAGSSARCGTRCGAISKRNSRPCRLFSRSPSGRCHVHGGASTGPRTPEGKARSALNGRLGGRPRKRDNLHPPIIQTPQDKP